MGLRMPLAHATLLEIFHAKAATASHNRVSAPPPAQVFNAGLQRRRLHSEQRRGALDPTIAPIASLKHLHDDNTTNVRLPRIPRMSIVRKTNSGHLRSPVPYSASAAQLPTALRVIRWPARGPPKQCWLVGQFTIEPGLPSPWNEKVIITPVQAGTRLNSSAELSEGAAKSIRTVSIPDTANVPPSSFPRRLLGRASTVAFCRAQPAAQKRG
jgi:hypothetical protein